MNKEEKNRIMAESLRRHLGLSLISLAENIRLLGVEFRDGPQLMCVLDQYYRLFSSFKSELSKTEDVFEEYLSEKRKAGVVFK